MGSQAKVDIVGGKSQASRRLSKNSAFGRQVLTQSAQKIRPKINEIGKEAVMRAEAKIASLYLQRSGNRHKTNAVPLAGSMKYKVTRNTDGSSPTFPYTVSLYSNADVKHVMSLNYGARSHRITARNGRVLIFPSTGAEWRKAMTSGPGEKRVAVKQRFTKSDSASRYLIDTRPGQGKGRRGRRVGKYDGLIAKPYVDHPGVSASYFMQLALERAVVIHLRKSVLLERSNT